jgi:hypothetical protein
MANSRTTYQDRSGGDGPTASGDTFVWVSLRDPSPEELASVQREFGLAEPLVEQLGAVTKRPAPEVVGERAFAVVKTVRWEAAEEEIRSGEVQLVLGEGFVVSVDRDAAILEQVRQDLQADPELVGAELAAVLPCVVDHAADSYGCWSSGEPWPAHRAARPPGRPVVDRRRRAAQAALSRAARPPAPGGPSVARWCWWSWPSSAWGCTGVPAQRLAVAGRRSAR